MNARWAGAGLVTLGGLTGFVLVSHGYGPSRAHLPLYIFSVTVHLVAVLASRKLPNSRSALWFMVALALLLRGVVCFTPESREADYYRYMWDGALSAHGVSPYRFSPAQILRGEADSAQVRLLAEEGHQVLARVNHPELRTLYPPVAQGLFALSYWLGPFSSNAWRVVLFLPDLAAGLLIVVLLRRANLPLAWAVTFLWNPLLIVETYHYRHLDLALAPFLLLFLLGLWKQRPYMAAAALAGAVAVKLWPVLLVPFLAIGFWGCRARMIKSLLLFAVLLGILFIPYWTSMGSEANSGTVAYAKKWDANEFAFRLFEPLGISISRQLPLTVDGRIVSRAILFALLLGGSAWFAFLAARRELGSVALALANLPLLMLLAGPTVYPWYFVPALALAPFLRRPSFLFWAPLLVLTYLSRSAPNALFLLALVHIPAWAILTLQIGDLYRHGVKTDA
ncbi:MAG: DUF2029 domain-containing protein [Acidobacteria bacterium]|nr:MAG: DUF2029 domain-containing protein [Acidobacteriota bacterium]